MKFVAKVIEESKFILLVMLVPYHAMALADNKIKCR